MYTSVVIKHVIYIYKCKLDMFILLELSTILKRLPTSQVTRYLSVVGILLSNPKCDGPNSHGDGLGLPSMWFIYLTGRC